jgi:hypothetical protein
MISGKIFATRINSLRNQKKKLTSELFKLQTDDPGVTTLMNDIDAMHWSIINDENNYKLFLQGIRSWLETNHECGSTVLDPPTSNFQKPPSCKKKSKRDGTLAQREFVWDTEGVKYFKGGIQKGTIPLETISGFSLEEKQIGEFGIQYISIVDNTEREWKIFPESSGSHSKKNLLVWYYTILGKLHGM